MNNFYLVYLVYCIGELWHLFDQMYIDKVDFEETLTHDRLINLIFTWMHWKQRRRFERGRVFWNDNATRWVGSCNFLTAIMEQSVMEIT